MIRRLCRVPRASLGALLAAIVVFTAGCANSADVGEPTANGPSSRSTTEPATNRPGTHEADNAGTGEHTDALPAAEASMGVDEILDPANVLSHDASRHEAPRAEPTAATNLAVGEVAPVVPVPLLHHESEVVDWEALRGRWVLVMFWVSWCEQCRAVIDQQLQPLAAGYAGAGGGERGLAVVAAGLPVNDSRLDQQQAMAEVGDWWLAAHDEAFPGSASLAGAFGVENAPVLVVLDPDGRVATFGLPMRAEWMNRLRAFLAAHLAGE